MTGHLTTLFAAAATAASGAFMLFFSHRSAARAEAAYEARIEDRLARGRDAYHEELRALRAYPPIRSLNRRRCVGAALLLLGIALFVLNLFVTE